jgi:hypothetical protein
MFKKYLLWSLASLIAWAIISAYIHYAKSHPDPNQAKINKAMNQKIQTDPQYKILKDLQDEKKSITE